MGWFDKVKASVGVGGATIELLMPVAATSGSNVPVRVIVRGGKIEQRLNVVQVTMEVWPDPNTPREGNAPAPGPAVLVDKRVPGSEGLVIAPGAELFFETTLEAPVCTTLYEDEPERYAGLVLGTEDDEAVWRVDDLDTPLPTMSGWESKKVMVRVSADIPGAVDPSTATQLHVIPEAAGPMSMASSLDADTLLARLEALGAERALLSNESDRWFIWWARGTGHVVGYSPIQIVCSVRPEGVVRATTNPRIPVPSVFAKLSSETAERIDGGMDEARAWAQSLVQARGGGTVLLPRPVGNAFAALTGLVLAS